MIHHPLALLGTVAGGSVVVGVAMKKPRMGFPKATMSLPGSRELSGERGSAASPVDLPLLSGESLHDAAEKRDGYLGFLNREAVEGGRIAHALVNAGVADRERLLRANPSWVRIGTFQSILRLARSAFDSDPMLALELTTFVVSYLERLVAPSDELAFLVSSVRGAAWKEHGNALYAHERFDDALTAATRAVELFSIDPFHAVHRARAQVLQTLVLLEMRSDDAARCLGDATDVLAEHGDAHGYIAALQVRAMCAFKQKAYEGARDLYSAALREAEQSNDEREVARIHHNLGFCFLSLGDRDAAQEYMTRAFVGFSRLRLDSELQRAIWVTAKIEADRGNLDGALQTLHAVYGRFLELGMVAEATRVLVVIGDAVTGLTGDTAYAKDVCAKLAVTLGRYDAPAQVRKTIDELRSATTAAQSVGTLRAALARAVSLLAAFRDHREEALPTLPSSDEYA